jgi:hypothetical protein
MRAYIDQREPYVALSYALLSMRRFDKERLLGQKQKGQIPFLRIRLVMRILLNQGDSRI